MAIDLPLNITASGPIPTPPVTIRTTLISNVAAAVPDYTANLPASLIEDVSSTDVGAIAMIDQLRVDTINALPIVANAYLTTQLGQQLGIPQGTPFNTSVDVVFSTPSSGPGSSPGYVIPAGFQISDGSHTYVTQEGTIIGAGFSSSTVTAIAVDSGSWAVPEGSVTSILTSVPSPYTITVTNPQAGIPAQGVESLESYQARVIQGQLAAGVGVIEYLRTLIQAVPGVVGRLVNVLQVSSGWKIIVGGGDVYAVANAIFLGMSDISRLVASATSGRNVSVSIVQPPNSYTVIYINPPLQAVTGTLTWNTNLPNFTSGSQVDALAAPALVSYINSIQQGQPINLNEAAAVFQNAVSSVLSPINITAISWSISLNAIVTPPDAGTQAISGDPESYFGAVANAITVVQG